MMFSITNPIQPNMRPHLWHTMESMNGIFIAQLCPKAEVLMFTRPLALFW